MKQGNYSFAPKEEMILESTSRTLSPTVAHAGEKENDFLQPKERPFPPDPPLGLATWVLSLLLSNSLPACLPQGSAALHRGLAAAAAQVVGFLDTL